MIPTIYTGKIRGVDVRFFPPKTHAELMPWVAADELMAAMALTHGQQTAANSTILKDPKHGARIGTSKGFTNIISFSNAKGLIQASVHMGYMAASPRPWQHCERTRVADLAVGGPTGRRCVVQATGK
jgi:hypothetical protein